MEQRWDVVVVGAGLAGLAAAATAATRSSSVLLLDGREPGGRAATDHVGRFRFNRGAHALYRSGPGRGVLDRLGVEVSAAPPLNSDAHGRLGQQIGLLPWGPDALARTTLVAQSDKTALAKVLDDIGRWHPEEVATQTAADWLDGLALPPSARRFLETQVRLVTYVADLDQVSADLVLIQLQQDPIVDYLHGGWARLIDGLTRRATRLGAKITVGHKVRRIAPEGRWVRVDIDADDQPVLGRQVVLAAGAPAAFANLLPHRPAAWDRLGPALTCAALDLGLAKMPPRRVVLAFDRPLYFSVHAPPATLAPAGGAVAHLLRYLRPGEALSAKAGKAELLDHADAAGVDESSIEELRYLHRMVVTGGVPLPEHGGLSGRPGVTETGLDGVLIAGDWVGPEGHLADASLASGEAAGLAATNAVAGVPALHTLR